jgi:cobalt/nickel transport system ATP-binding protein
LAIVARQLWYRYPDGDWLLRGVDVVIKPGEVVGVVGETGSGKTTLLLILAGLIKPQKGSVLVDGVEAWRQEARRLIGIVFQNPDDQIFNPTVYDEIAFALRSLGLDEDKVRASVEAVSRRVGVNGLLDRNPYRLSHGQKRLIALASVLVYEPRYLLLDEPTAFLDPKTTRRIFCIVEEEARRGRGVVITAHHPSQLPSIVSKVCLLAGGSLTCTSPDRASKLIGSQPRGCTS